MRLERRCRGLRGRAARRPRIRRRCRSRRGRPRRAARARRAAARPAAMTHRARREGPARPSAAALEHAVPRPGRAPRSTARVIQRPRWRTKAGWNMQPPTSSCRGGRRRTGSARRRRAARSWRRRSGCAAARARPRAALREARPRSPGRPLRRRRAGPAARACAAGAMPAASAAPRIRPKAGRTSNSRRTPRSGIDVRVAQLGAHALGRQALPGPVGRRGPISEASRRIHPSARSRACVSLSLVVPVLSGVRGRAGRHRHRQRARRVHDRGLAGDPRGRPPRRGSCRRSTGART